MRKFIIHSQDANLVALLMGLLSDIEATFEHTSSREELFAKCLNSKYDLVLTDDVRMFMNGTDAIREIRHNTVLPQIFILSHDISEDTVTALLEDGINQFISLPITPERFRGKLFSKL